MSHIFIYKKAYNSFLFSIDSILNIFRNNSVNLSLIIITKNYIFIIHIFWHQTLENNFNNSLNIIILLF